MHAYILLCGVKPHNKEENKMNYKEAKAKIREVLTYYYVEESVEFHPFDEKDIIQMMAEIRTDEDTETALADKQEWDYE